MTQEDIDAELDAHSRYLEITAALLAMIFLLILALWTVTHTKAEPGVYAPSRCSTYRRCCAPRCRFAVTGENKWPLVQQRFS